MLAEACAAQHSGCHAKARSLPYAHILAADLGLGARTLQGSVDSDQLVQYGLHLRIIQGHRNTLCFQVYVVFTCQMAALYIPHFVNPVLAIQPYCCRLCPFCWCPAAMICYRHNSSSQ